YTYTKFLPNAGITYSLGDLGQLYATYAQGFSAPKTDDLYSSTPESVVPEQSKEYGLGWRMATPDFNLSANLFRTDYQNRIVQTFDPNDSTLSIDRNVGDVRIQGLDIEGGWHVLDHLTLYGSAAFLDTNVEGDLFQTVAGHVVTLPTRGKDLVLFPEQEYAA